MIKRHLMNCRFKIKKSIWITKLFKMKWKVHHACLDLIATTRITFLTLLPLINCKGDLRLMSQRSHSFLYLVGQNRLHITFSFSKKCSKLNNKSYCNNWLKKIKSMTFSKNNTKTWRTNINHWLIPLNKLWLKLRQTKMMK